MSLPRTPTKYHAIRTTVDGIAFASKAEAARYGELKLLERANAITGLELQPKFPICVPVPGRTNVSQAVCTYVADFRYREGPSGVLVIEDVKGMRTAVYKLKKKLVEAQYGIRITEIT